MIVSSQGIRQLSSAGWTYPCISCPPGSMQCCVAGVLLRKPTAHMPNRVTCRHAHEAKIAYAHNKGTMGVIMYTVCLLTLALGPRHRIAVLCSAVPCFGEILRSRTKCTVGTRVTRAHRHLLGTRDQEIVGRRTRHRIQFTSSHEQGIRYRWIGTVRHRS